MRSLQGKVAVVTGASSGIGQAIVEKLAAEGAKVALIARRLDRMEAIIESLTEAYGAEAIAIEADVRQAEALEEAVNQVMDRFSGIDILVNNAGVITNSSLIKGSIQDWDQMIDVNLKAVLYGIHAVLPHMLEKSSGHIVNMASVSGFEVTKHSAVYSATKFAVRALSMGLEKELARTGVRVTNISPGMVDTDLSSRVNVDRKILEPEDIASSVHYAVTQPDYVNVNEITVRPV